MVSNNIHQRLIQLGLSDGEAKVYLALSKIGPSTVGPIVKNARVAYSNVYDILNRLMEKGIVSYITNQKTKYFQAASPKNLLKYLENREKEIKTLQTDCRLLILEIEALQQITGQQKAELFIGKRGLRTAYEKHLSSGKKKENLFFYIHKDRYAKEADSFYFSILDFFTKTPQKGMVNEYARVSPWFQKIKKVKIRYANFPIPGNIEVCGNSLLLISWEKPVTSVLIESKDLADNLREYFQAVWKKGRE